MKKSNLLLKLGTITLCTSLLIRPTTFAKGNGRGNRGDNKARAVYCQRNNGEAGVKKFDG